MTISSLIGSRLLSGIAAFALTGSLLGGTAMAAQPDSPVREIRHDVRDQSKAQREEIKQLRADFAAEYAKERPDTAELKRLHAAIEAKRDEIEAMRFDALLKMHDELDATQRAKMAEHMEHGGKGHGKDGREDGAKADGKGKGEAKRGERGERGERPDAKPETAGKGKADKDKADKGKADKANRGKGRSKANDAAPV